MSSFKDIKKESRVLNIKSKSAGPWGEGKPDASDGVCPKCGQYDVEVDSNGFCRDVDCKSKRLIDALHSGEAIKVPNGPIVWTHGHKLRKDF